MRRWGGLLVVVGVVSVWAISARAVLLTEDAFVSLPGTTVADRPELEGLIIEDHTVSFTMGLITGSIQERVVREDGTGTLDFYWRVFNDETSEGSIGSLRIGAFITGTYDADWRIDGLGDTPPQDGYLFGGAYSGLGYVNFIFGANAALNPGDESMFMFLHTDATAYDHTAAMDVATPGYLEMSESFATFAPSRGVPDGGATVTLIGLGLSGLAILRRKLA